jgi:hypothetical protein
MLPEKISGRPIISPIQIDPKKFRDTIDPVKRSDQNSSGELIRKNFLFDSGTTSLINTRSILRKIPGILFSGLR